jgi:putative selenium metabolism protein SsnA
VEDQEDRVQGEGVKDATLALCGATVVRSLDQPEVERADVVIAGERIAMIGTAPTGVRMRDCTGTLVLPGNVCAHHHLYSALARGMPYRLAPPRDFLEILQRVWWRLDRALDEASIRASALRGGLDALLAGTTTIVDHHASPNAIDGSLDVIAGALDELGIRSVLCYEVTDRDGPERARDGLAENARFLRKAGGLSRGMMGAHASFTLGDDTLAACVEEARQAGAGVHVHVAEDGVDRQALPRLVAAGVLEGEALLAHCVHVDAPAIGTIEAAGATVVCNPRSNMNNGVGRSPFNHRTGKVALGTDGIDGNMFVEAQAGFFRTREEDLDVPFDWPLRRLAESARFAGRCHGEPMLGTLRPGAPADITVLEVDPPTPIDAANLAGHLVFGLAGTRVRDVVVAGRLVVADRRSTLVDEREIAAGSRSETERLWRRLDEIAPHPFTPEERR